MYLFGFKQKQKVAVGPGRIIRNPDTEAKAGIIEFTGQGLNAVVAALESKERKMAVLGSRLLEEQKKSAEAAETLQIRTSGETATLFTIANNVESGMGKVLYYESLWYSYPDSTKVDMNKDFINKQIDARILAELLKALQAGEVSQDTWLFNLKDGELIADDVTIEDEKKKIEKERKEREAREKQKAEEEAARLMEMRQQGGQVDDNQDDDPKEGGEPKQFGKPKQDKPFEQDKVKDKNKKVQQ
jgi:hypothetical protein